MIRMLLALAVVGLVVVTSMRMFSSQVGGVARVTGENLGGAAVTGAAAAPPANPRATVDQTAQAVQQALQQGAAAQAARASEAGN